jgi:hypothetical protein
MRRKNQAPPSCAKNFATPLEVCKDEEIAFDQRSAS